jgi:thiol-disulfide isomerase/thioredoxin
MLIGLGVLFLIGVVGCAILWLGLGARAAGLYLLARISLLAVGLGLGVVLSRLICGEPVSRLLTGGRARGDLSCLAFLAGLLLLPGVVGPHLPSASGGQGQLATGQPVELSGPTLDGGRFDLAEHRGKVVLIDFWATWCPPCVAELPNVQAVHDEFHDQGLEVVSVSLDFQRSALVKFLQAKPLPWPQIFFNPKDPAGQEHHPARRYGIQAIPCLLVVDREGKLVARDVRGGAIRTAVARALGQPVSWGARLAEAGSRLLQAVFYSVLASAWWLFLLCGVGAAVLAACAEAVVRRAFRRTAAT